MKTNLLITALLLSIFSVTACKPTTVEVNVKQAKDSRSFEELIENIDCSDIGKLNIKDDELLDRVRHFCTSRTDFFVPTPPREY